MKVFLGGKNNSSLVSISPLSGRYREKVVELEEYTSEYALIKTRIEIEVKYLLALSKIRLVNLTTAERKKLLNLVQNFNFSDSTRVKEIEETTKHDVKAVELFLRNFLSKENSEMIHFGLTSYDVNDIAFRLMLRDASQKVIVPFLISLNKKLQNFAKEYKHLPMLGRTHGQPALPTTLGKEFAVFASRLSLELNKLNKVRLTGKLNGAVGNYNALHFAYPKINWVNFSKAFVRSFRLEPNLITTQIDPYEDIIEYFQTIQRVNGILLDLDQDLWRYISDGWLVQKGDKGQVGSSTMPQKINPIDFENSEGNLELANGLVEVFTRKLAVSRLQRDLSNSTIIRNIGVVLGYSLLAYKGTLVGLSKVKVDRDQVLVDLNKDWSILAEAIQIIFRKEKIKGSYLKVVEMTKGKHFGEAEWKDLVLSFPISKENRDKLLALTPSTYLGLAKKLT